MLITLIAAGVASLLWLLWICTTYKEEGREIILSSFLVFILTLIIGAGVLISVHAHTAKYETRLESTTYIYSIEVPEDEDITFLLCTGTVEQEKVFVYNKKTITGEFTVDYVSSKKSKVIESDVDAPMIKRYGEYALNPSWWTDLGTLTDGRDHYEIIVPIGTVRKIYDGRLESK